jgi:hypothetical protein
MALAQQPFCDGRGLLEPILTGIEVGSILQHDKGLRVFIEALGLPTVPSKVQMRSSPLLRAMQTAILVRRGLMEAGISVDNSIQRTPFVLENASRYDIFQSLVGGGATENSTTMHESNNGAKELEEAYGVPVAPGCSPLPCSANEKEKIVMKKGSANQQCEFLSKVVPLLPTDAVTLVVSHGTFLNKAYLQGVTVNGETFFPTNTESFIISYVATPGLPMLIAVLKRIIPPPLPDVFPDIPDSGQACTMNINS